jgi:hypothetical protein
LYIIIITNRTIGHNRAGPTPQTAIRNGEMSIGDNTAFMYSTLNADKCYWIVDDVKGATKYASVNSDE